MNELFLNRDIMRPYLFRVSISNISPDKTIFPNQPVHQRFEVGDENFPVLPEHVVSFAPPELKAEGSSYMLGQFDMSRPVLNLNERTFTITFREDEFHTIENFCLWQKSCIMDDDGYYQTEKITKRLMVVAEYLNAQLEVTKRKIFFNVVLTGIPSITSDYASSEVVTYQLTFSYDYMQQHSL